MDKVLCCIVLMSISAMVGCKSSVFPADQQVSAYKSIHLKQPQLYVVKGGVKQILGMPFKFYKPKAIKLNGENGIHVCGHVSLKGGSSDELVYYVELEEDLDSPKLKRGQVGTDPSKLSKVKFMCRRHGNI